MVLLAWGSPVLLRDQWLVHQGWEESVWPEGSGITLSVLCGIMLGKRWRWYWRSRRLRRKRSKIQSTWQSMKIHRTVCSCHDALRLDPCEIHQHARRNGHHEGTLFGWEVWSLSQSYVRKTKCDACRDQLGSQNRKGQALLSEVQGYLFTKEEVFWYWWSVLWHYFSASHANGTSFVR